MKQLFIILVLCFVAPLFAADKDIEAYKRKVYKKYYYRAIDQKYEYNHARRAVHAQGKLRVLRAKYDQKVSGRYRYYSMYSQRACPR